MFSLRGPVNAEFVLGGEKMLPPSDWRAVIGKLTPFVNELKLWDAGAYSEKYDISELMDALDEGKKYYHLGIAGKTRFEELLKKAKASSYFGSFIFDFPSSDEAVFRAQGGNLEDMQAQIEAAVAAGFEANVRIPINAHTYQGLTETAEFCFDLGVNFAIFERYIGSNSDPLFLSADKLSEAMEAIEQMRSFGYNVCLGNCVPNCFFNSESYGCQGGIVTACVDSEGFMLPCRCSSLRAGSLLEHEVTELWRSEIMESWRADIPEACAGCAHSGMCAGGCRSMGKICGCGQDPLICGPVADKEQFLHEVTLEEELCPVPKYSVRDEDFGWALIKANKVIPVTFKAGEVLEKFDGKTSLGEIERELGAPALSFIYSLYVRGFVEFKEPCAENPVSE